MRQPSVRAARQTATHTGGDLDARRRARARAILRDIARIEGARWLLREAEVIAMWSTALGQPETDPGDPAGPPSFAPLDGFRALTRPTS